MKRSMKTATLLAGALGLFAGFATAASSGSAGAAQAEPQETMTVLPNGTVLIQNKKLWMTHADGTVEVRYVTVRARPVLKPIPYAQRQKP